MIADLISAGVQPGCFCRSSAAVPETCGVAIDVPSYRPTTGGGDSVPFAMASCVGWSGGR